MSLISVLMLNTGSGHISSKYEIWQVFNTKMIVCHFQLYCCTGELYTSICDQERFGELTYSDQLDPSNITCMKDIDQSQASRFTAKEPTYIQSSDL